MMLFGRTAGDEQDERKGIGERSCAATAPGGISSWMHGMRYSLTRFACAPSGTAKHLAVPPACCRRGHRHVHAFRSESS